ncbi:hypothetical protein [Dongshaea marina]|uniref:hypothetical protein n=1 Tax=Dongshaea marina TaxID=2047966 RepID=UPI00131F11C9|nr:hypothetical protein [Dongshaea marina]
MIIRLIGTLLAAILALLLLNLFETNQLLGLTGTFIVMITGCLLHKSKLFPYGGIILAIYFFMFIWGGILEPTHFSSAIYAMCVQTLLGTILCLLFSQKSAHKRHYLNLLTTRHPVRPKLAIDMGMLSSSIKFSLCYLSMGILVTLLKLPISGTALVPMIMLINPEYSAGMRYGSNRAMGGILFILPSLILLMLLQNICDNILIMLPVIAIILFVLAYHGISNGHEYGYCQAAAMLLIVLTAGFSSMPLQSIFSDVFQRSFGALLGLAMGWILFMTLFHPESILANRHKALSDDTPHGND